MLADTAVGLFAGLVATQVTNLAQGPLQRITPDSVKWWEKRVRPDGTSSLVAARKAADCMRCSPGQRRLTLLGKAVHFGVGMAWGPVYGLLRHASGLGPFGASLATEAAMSLILDEGLVPVLGLSAPNRDYPAFTHVRGFLAHLVYGAAAALVAEALGRPSGAPNRQGRAGQAPPPCNAAPRRCRSRRHGSRRVRVQAPAAPATCRWR
jgi:hypothetical protein